MLHLAQRSKLFGASTRVLASTSGRYLSLTADAPQKKAVIFNLAGGVVPSMNPVFTEYALKYTIPPKPAEIKQKVLMEADDPQLLANVNIMLASRNGSQDENTRDLIDAIESVQAEGWKAILVGDHGNFNNVPFDASVFDQVIPELSPQFVELLDPEIEKSDIVYIDSAAENLQAAAALGLSTIEASNSSYLETLTALEGKLGIPLKACIPGLTFSWYDKKANNPHKSGNFLYGFMVYVTLMSGCLFIGKLGN